MHKPWYLYVVSQADCSGPCKIGITSNLDTRFMGLQTGSPSKLKLFSSMVFPCRKTASKIEKTIHFSLERDGFRLEGEWFNMQALSAWQHCIYVLFACSYGISCMQYEDEPEAVRLDIVADILSESLILCKTDADDLAFHFWNRMNKEKGVKA